MSLTLELYKSTLPAIDQIINRKLEALPKMKGFGRVAMEEEVNDLTKMAIHLEKIFEKADQLLMVLSMENKMAEKRTEQWANLSRVAAIDAEMKDYNSIYYGLKHKAGNAPHWERLLPALTHLKEDTQKVIAKYQKMNTP